MNILILGNDGYIGYPLTIHLLKKGYNVCGLDDESRRDRVLNVGSNSLTPITPLNLRIMNLKKNYENYKYQFNCTLGLNSHGRILDILKASKPDCIVHLAEMPSAPWSMMDSRYAIITQHENILGTLDLLWAMKEVCPEAHLVKLGTMGEYGTPYCDIPEGKIPRNCLAGYTGFPTYPTTEGPPAECPMQSLPFPRSPGSFYHLSKVHDTHNIIFACKNWNLRSTDIMQGVVFGLLGEGPEITRFDYDEYFGTAINRFCAQAIIDHPLTVYGTGKQTRGFLPLKDSIQCLTLAIENPPKVGEYRTFNQFENIYSINELAKMVQLSYNSIVVGGNIPIHHLPNPRNESEDHYYNPAHQKLFDLGYKPTTNISEEITTLIEQLLPFEDRVKKEVIMPKTNWK